MDIFNAFLNYENKTNEKNNLCNEFKLPIEFLENKILLNENIINDLELKEFKNEDINKSDISINENVDSIKNRNNLYYSLLNPDNILDKNIIDKWSNYYTDDVNFLKDTQIMLKEFL